MPQSSLDILILIKNLMIDFMLLPLPWINMRLGTLVIGIMTTFVLFRLLPRIVDMVQSSANSNNKR